ncbi:unnamed protein product [Phytophthora fragariaefolia]|uniref:Unnamed protein product n=1 Tax=Phytophthora fragariaefolia TaxID=1490495 RepID=A0A9W6XPX6_9STRA|nr:unnamed protein product [Phytophthora fragariaefolia]
MELGRVARQVGAAQEEVPCPRVVTDYHALMGGVDVHDQLRLQRYSLQPALRFKKYYKSLALGLIDLVIVNNYVVHKAYYQNKQSRHLSHFKFMKKLHLQLCRVQASDMYEGNAFGTAQPAPPPVYESVPVGGNEASSPSRRVAQRRVASQEAAADLQSMLGAAHGQGDSVDYSLFLRKLQ